MLKWFVYIVFSLVSTPGILLAKTTKSRVTHAAALHYDLVYLSPINANFADTIKVVKTSAKLDLKVKEVPKSKRQPKPEKVDDAADAKKAKEKPKRERRPDGMDRPPEIPRRNDN